jgi:membrane protease YdiL (CAAX protease family)
VSSRARAGAVLFAILYPSALTFAYFVALEEMPSQYQQLVYSIGKLIQFGFPLLWVWLILKRRVSQVTPWAGERSIDQHARASVDVETSAEAGNSRINILSGLAFGAAVALAMWLLVHGWLQQTDIFPKLQEAAWEKVHDLGLTSSWKYAAVALFYALMHSFLEEYYWRWFVYGQLRQWLGPFAAIMVSSVGFMLHHVILLATYFGWSSPLAYLLSMGVGIGGLVWAYLYERSRSLIGPWISHMVVDAAIFWVGYELVRANFS